MPKGKSAAEVRAELEATLASELVARKFSYKRTDDSQWTLDAQGRARSHVRFGDGV